MKLQYDPAENQIFWNLIRQIPGYPLGDEINLRTIIIESNGLLRLPNVIESFNVKEDSPLLVVTDATPMQRGSEPLKPLVLSLVQRCCPQPQVLILAPDESCQVHTEMRHIQSVKERITPNSVVISVGSGTVTDIVKHACYLYEKENSIHIPFVVVQTANSVSAYTSNMAPVSIEGVKRTLPSRYPDALICDLETLRDAPYDMTVAGVGDLLAAFVSFPDWYLANRLGLDPTYNDFSKVLIGPLDEILLQTAVEIRSGSLDGACILAKLISLAGLVMSLAHATAPLSGYEHIISHVLDLQAELARQPLAMHGTQVALASILGAETYRKWLRYFDPDELETNDCHPLPEKMRQQVMEVYNSIDPSGKTGLECWSDYQIKLSDWNRMQKEIKAFSHDWPEIRSQILKLACPPERLVEILKAIAGPLNFAEMVPPVPERTVKFAYLNAPFMRKRFTIGDLPIFLNWDREKMWQEVWAETQATK
jgi:glycerol-1-phosphate dehydrogenase [NAD(P)+]